MGVLPLTTDGVDVISDRRSTGVVVSFSSDN
jgi:hypothetical protein